MFSKLKEYLKRIVKWQKTPTAPPEMSVEECVCKNCGETYKANYCPRCGQSAKTPRLGSRSALSIFIDTWGLGRSGLLRTLWQLFSRPGYMIGDYIDGRRQFYFPPFKTLFVVGTAFALIFALSGGFSESNKARRKSADDMKVLLVDLSANTDTTAATDKNQKVNLAAKNKRLKEDMIVLGNMFAVYSEWREHNFTTNQLMTHIVFAVLAWIIFRKSPRRPRMNLAENVIAQVYICAQMATLAIISMLVSLPIKGYPTGEIPSYLTFLFFLYDYKQLYGYGVWRTLWKTFLMFLVYTCFIFIVIGSTIIAYIIHSYAVG